MLNKALVIVAFFIRTIGDNYATTTTKQEISGNLGYNINYSIALNNGKQGNDMRQSPFLSLVLYIPLQSLGNNSISNEELQKQFLEKSSKELQKQHGVTTSWLKTINNLSREFFQVNPSNTVTQDDPNKCIQKCKYNRYMEKELSLKVLSDNKVVDNLLSENINTDNFKLFLNTNDPKSVFVSLYNKMNSEAILSCEKNTLSQLDLTSPERRLMFYLFILNEQKLNNSNNDKINKCLDNIKSLCININKLDINELIENCSKLSPYYEAIANIETTDTRFDDYKKFFNYTSLSEISTALLVLKHLNGIVISGAIGVVKDSLDSFINNFIMNGFNKSDPELFQHFLNLSNTYSE